METAKRFTRWWPFVALAIATGIIIEWPASIVAGVARIFVVGVVGGVAWVWAKPSLRRMLAGIDRYFNGMGGWMR